MLRFADAVTHRDTGPLAAAIAMSIEPRRPTLIPKMRIALGWHVRNKNGQRIVWHNGGTGGFRTFFGFNPATGANVVVLSRTTRWLPPCGGERDARRRDAIVASEQSTPLSPVGESPSNFYLRVVPAKVSFARDSTGVPVLRLTQNFATQRARKQ